MQNKSFDANEEKSKRKISCCSNLLNDFAQKHAFKTVQIKIAIVLICIILVLGVAAGVGSTTILKGKTKALGLKNIGELVTQAAFFTEVKSLDEARDIWGIKVPFTSSSYVFSYDGVIKAGLDFADISTTVDEIKHQIIIELPEVKILSISLDEESLQVYTEEKNVYTPFTPEKMNSAIADMKKNAEKTSIENGLLENARENAKMLIEGYLSSLYDLQVYTVVYK